MSFPSSVWPYLALSAVIDEAYRARFVRPTARLREARWLAERGTHAMIDVSDGLAQDLGHLAAVLGMVGELAGAAPDPDAVRLAAWYHDVVYDPRSAENEARSAGRARAGLRGLVDDERLAEVERLVLLTVDHDAEPDDANGAVLCDADLAVLAAPPDAYAGYASAVRAEYSDSPAALAVCARSA